MVVKNWYGYSFNPKWTRIAGGLSKYKLKHKDGEYNCIMKASFTQNLGAANGNHYDNHINIANVSNDFRPFDFDKNLDIRFNLFIDSRIYSQTVLNTYHPLCNREKLENIQTENPKWISIGENLEFKIKNGFIYNKFDPFKTLGPSNSNDSILVASNRTDHYPFRKLFEKPYVLIFNRNRKLYNKEKLYLKNLELGFNCFLMKYRRNYYFQ